MTLHSSSPHSSNPWRGVHLRRMTSSRRGLPAQPSAAVDVDAPVLERCLAGCVAARRHLVQTLTPVIRARVARSLLRRSESRGRDLSHTLDDLTQSVFLALFEANAKKLRAWDPARGVPVRRFVAFLAQREVASILRRQRSNPWQEDPTAADDLDAVLPSSPPAESRLESRELLRKVLPRLNHQLTPRGQQLMRRLLLEQADVESVCQEMNMQPAAVYAWRSRLSRRLREVMRELEPAGV